VQDVSAGKMRPLQAKLGLFEVQPSSDTIDWNSFSQNCKKQLRNIPMASFRVPALRHVISGAPPYLRATQRRWAQVHDIRFLATQQSDRVIEKYKAKLAQKAKAYGSYQSF